jgi:hypothetical protein
VTYARVGGVSSTYSSSVANTYTGAAYVVSGSYIDGAWVQNTSAAQWITAPGASTSYVANSSTVDQGGDYLPGNGTSGSTAAYYVYRLAFTISGTGSGTVTNNLSMTIAADDSYTVYVNPASAPTVSSSGFISAGGTTASASGTSAWTNTTAITLANYGSSDNADFVIGTNYIYVVVSNSNSLTGSSSVSHLNPSGLLVYQVGSAITIDGRPIPEVGTWMPMVGALGLFGWVGWRRRRAAAA